MNILILGGTVFVGRHIVEAALNKGHRVTLFNRGQRNTDLFPDVEKLRGDRNGDLSALSGRRFDAVIDTCGYKPAQMQAVVGALGDHVAHYVFISSVSAHKFPRANTEYDEKTATLDGDEGYGEEKARSEEVIAAAYPGRVAIIRPGLIVGPHDPTGRFVYWPLRAARGGDILVPGRPDRPIQWIDVRDLAEWVVHAVDNKLVGYFNAITPARMYSMSDLVDACVAESGVDSTQHWVDDATVEAAGIAAWTDLPMWIPDSSETASLMLGRSDRAVAAGLRFRGVEQTVRDTLSWARTLPANDDRLGAAKTLSPEREAEVLRRLGLN